MEVVPESGGKLGRLVANPPTAVEVSITSPEMETTAKPDLMRMSDCVCQNGGLRTTEATGMDLVPSEQ
jgi:hypothetical protein